MVRLSRYAAAAALGLFVTGSAQAWVVRNTVIVDNVGNGRGNDVDINENGKRDTTIVNASGNGRGNTIDIDPDAGDRVIVKGSGNGRGNTIDIGANPGGTVVIDASSIGKGNKVIVDKAPDQKVIVINSANGKDNNIIINNVDANGKPIKNQPKGGKDQPAGSNHTRPGQNHSPTGKDGPFGNVFNPKTDLPMAGKFTPPSDRGIPFVTKDMLEKAKLQDSRTVTMKAPGNFDGKVTLPRTPFTTLPKKVFEPQTLAQVSRVTSDPRVTTPIFPKSATDPRVTTPTFPKSSFSPKVASQVSKPQTTFKPEVKTAPAKSATPPTRTARR